MANTVDQLSEKAKCINGLDDRAKQAAKVYYLYKRAIGLSSIASYDLDTLATSAACYQNLSDDVTASALVVVAQEKATVADALVTSDFAALSEAIKCLKHHNPQMLMAMELYIRDISSS